MSIKVSDVKNAINRLCDIIISNEKYFCELDSVAGDGDFGMSLSSGFKEIKKQESEIDNSNVYSFIRGCAMILAEFCGGASGPIWSTAFNEAAHVVKGRDDLELPEIAEMFVAAVGGIRKLGNELGDKTLIDALTPAAEALKDAADKGVSINEAFVAAADKATAGMEATKNMVAKRGRASYLGERSLGYPDAGAMAVSVIFCAFVNY